MAEKWMQYAEKVRKQTVRQGDLADFLNNPSIDLADACMTGAILRVIKALATGAASPYEYHDNNPVWHIALHKSLTLDELSGTTYIGDPEVGDRAKFGQILSIFVTYDCNIDAIGFDGVGAMHLAAEYGNIKLLAWLLDHKADIDLRATIGAHEMSGATPLVFAARAGECNSYRQFMTTFDKNN